MNITELKKAACLAVGLDENDPLEGRGQFRPFARQLIMSRLMEDGHTDTAVSMALGCDRVTVLHGCKTIRNIVTTHQKPYIDWVEKFNTLAPTVEDAVLVKARINGSYSVIIAAGRGSATLYPDRVQVLNKDGIKDYPKSILLTDVIKLITDKQI